MEHAVNITHMRVTDVVTRNWQNGWLLFTLARQPPKGVSGITYQTLSSDNTPGIIPTASTTAVLVTVSIVYVTKGA